MSCWRRWRVLWVVLLTLVPCLVAAQASVQYVYDDLGRLIAVVDTNGDTAVYHYDAVGNVLAIDRLTSSQVSIIAFSPQSGPVGTTVTIYGTGFSATPSQNTVTFHGTAATVSSATTTKLVVTVPSSATTGTVGVTSPLGSATSATAFTVAAAAQAPTITGFTPTTGVAGTAVTISGTNFDPTPANDRTRLNATLVPIATATTTALTTTVPPNAGSGHLSVSTPVGTVVSTADFIVPPSPYTPSDVAVSGRIPFSAATTVTVSTANKIGLALFDGTVGQRVSVWGTNGVSGQILGCDLFVSLLNTDNNVLASAICMEQSGFIDAVTLPRTGTYTILMDPASTVTGSVTLTLYNVPADVSGTITPGGSPVTVTTTTPGQNGALTFSGTMGQRISLLGTNGISGQILGCDLYASIVNPDQIAPPPVTCLEGSGFIDIQTLSATGAYTVRVDPQSAATGSVTLTLYTVPADVSGTITAGGSSVTVTITTPGQNGALTFSGTAGQRVSLLGSNGMTGQIIGCDVNVSILKPDSSVLAAATCMEGSGFIDVKTLPSTGTYTIVMDPVSSATGNLTLTLYNVPADFSGSITAGGSAVTVTINTPGQNGALTFSGTTGQRISLLGTNGMTGQIFGCDVNVSMLKPDSSVLAAATCMEGSGFIDVKTLPSTGMYTIVVDPVSTATGSLTLTLYTVPADTTGTVTINGSSVAVTLSTPGQNGTLTFSGTASQPVTVRVTGNTMGSVTVKLLSTNGTTVLATSTSSAGSFNLSPVTLPSTGTYTVSIDPGGANTGTMNVAGTSP